MNIKIQTGPLIDFLLNNFTPTNVIKPLRGKELLRVTEKTLLKEKHNKKDWIQGDEK